MRAVLFMLLVWGVCADDTVPRALMQDLSKFVGQVSTALSGADTETRDRSLVETKETKDRSKSKSLVGRVLDVASKNLGDLGNKLVKIGVQEAVQRFTQPRKMRRSLSKTIFGLDKFLDGLMQLQTLIAKVRREGNVTAEGANRLWRNGVMIVMGFVQEIKFFEMVKDQKETIAQTNWMTFEAHYRKVLKGSLMSREWSDEFARGMNDTVAIDAFEAMLAVTMQGRRDVAKRFLQGMFNVFRSAFEANGRVNLDRMQEIEGNITSRRDHILNMTNAGVNFQVSELERQQMRSLYNVYSKTYLRMVEYVNVTLKLHDLTSLIDTLRPVTQRGAVQLRCDAARGASGQFDPFRAQVCSEPSGKYEQWVPWLVAYSLFVVVASALFVISLVKRTGNVFVNLLLVSLVVACSVRVFWYVLWALPFGQGQAIPTAAFFTAETFAQLLFGLCLAIFSFVLVSANLETFFASKSRVLGVSLVVFMCVVGAGTLGYSLAMVIMYDSQMDQLDPVIDVRRLVIVGAMVVFSLLLEAGVVLTLVNVLRTDGMSSKAKSRAFIFLAASTLLLFGWITALVLTALYYFVDVTQFGAPMFTITGIFELLTCVCICLYSFFSFQLSLRSTLHTSASRLSSSGLSQRVSVNEEQVPLMYANY